MATETRRGLYLAACNVQTCIYFTLKFKAEAVDKNAEYESLTHVVREILVDDLVRQLVDFFVFVVLQGLNLVQA